MPQADVANPLCRSGGILAVTYRVTRRSRPPNCAMDPALYDPGQPAEIVLEEAIDENDREVLFLLSANDHDAVIEGVFFQGIEED